MPVKSKLGSGRQAAQVKAEGKTAPAWTTAFPLTSAQDHWKAALAWLLSTYRASKIRVIRVTGELGQDLLRLRTGICVYPASCVYTNLRRFRYTGNVSGEPRVPSPKPQSLKCFPLS